MMYASSGRSTEMYIIIVVVIIPSPMKLLMDALTNLSVRRSLVLSVRNAFDQHSSKPSLIVSTLSTL